MSVKKASGQPKTSTESDKPDYAPCCQCGQKPLKIDEISIFPTTDKSRPADLICPSIMCMIMELDAQEEINHVKF